MMKELVAIVCGFLHTKVLNIASRKKDKDFNITKGNNSRAKSLFKLFRCWQLIQSIQNHANKKQAMGTLVIVHSESFPNDTNIIRFSLFSKIVLL